MSELYTFLLFLLTGISIGILFDIFRIIRKNFKTRDFVTYIHDFLFWILTEIILLYSIFAFNNGELRGYIFIAIILGICMYILLFSRFFIQMSSKIISILKKILHIPINFLNTHLLTPILRLFAKLLGFISKFTRNIFKFNLKNKKNDKISNKIQ